MIILGIDLGMKRTGLALCDEQEVLAYPYKLLVELNKDNLLKKIFVEYKNSNAKKIVIGLPKNMSGTIGSSAQRTINFGKNLQKNYNIDIEFYDERRTTVFAHNFLNELDIRGKKRKNIVDMLSATIILQNYLDLLKNKK